jgi:ferredoxin-NADP reductase/ferredoxin
VTAELLADEVAGASTCDTRAVVLRFADGVTRDLSVADGQTVLAAAKQAGMNLASQCEVGTCCTCAARLVRGDAAMPAGQVTALTREEVTAGQRLLCQTLAHTDAEFDVEYPSSLLEANPAVEFTGKIARATWVAESVVQLDVKVPKSLRFRFTAGQYCRIRIPGTDEWRSYSMASGEHEHGRLSFLIRVLPTGAMSDFLRVEARPGTTLEMEGPLGGFVLDPSERPHLLVAGGTGLAPMLSMLDRIRLVRPTPPVLLVFGCVRENDLFLMDEVDARRSFMPSLEVRVSLEQQSALPGVVHGNPVAVLAAEDVRPGSVAYLCGPPGMIAAAEQKLRELGLDAGDIRAEQFLPS